MQELLAQVRDEHGSSAKIVSAERVRAGGITGLLRAERYELTVELPDPDPAGAPATATATTPAGARPVDAPPARPAMDGLLALLDEREAVTPDSAAVGATTALSPTATAGPTSAVGRPTAGSGATAPHPVGPVSRPDINAPPGGFGEALAQARGATGRSAADETAGFMADRAYPTAGANTQETSPMPDSSRVNGAARGALATAEPATAEPASAEPASAEPASAEPATAEPATAIRTAGVTGATGPTADGPGGPTADAPTASGPTGAGGPAVDAPTGATEPAGGEEYEAGQGYEAGYGAAIFTGGGNASPAAAPVTAPGVQPPGAATSAEPAATTPSTTPTATPTAALPGVGGPAVAEHPVTEVAVVSPTDAWETIAAADWPAAVAPAPDPGAQAPDDRAGTPTDARYGAHQATHAYGEPAARGLTDRLAALGVPERILRRLPADEAYPAIVSAFESEPAPPPLPTVPGAIIAVIGDLPGALAVADELCRTLRLESGRTLVASRSATLERHIADASDAARRAERLRTADTARLVAIDAPTASGDRWAQQVLAALRPEAVWFAVDATRKTADVARQLASLARVDALAVHGLHATADPASPLALRVPIALLDGNPAGPHEWAALLCRRLYEEPTNVDH